MLQKVNNVIRFRKCAVRTDPSHSPAHTEGRQSGFNHEERAQHIRVELTVKLLLAELLEGRKRVNACVVHEYIQAAEGFSRLRDEALRVGRVE
jgi:hypothetical protein